MDFKRYYYGFCCFLLLLLGNNILATPLPTPQFNARTLRSVVQHTLQYNPTVLRTLANRYAAHANSQVAMSGFMPKIFVRYSRGKEEGENPYNSEERITLTRTDQVLGVTQPLFSGFSTYNSVKQRQAEYHAASFNESAVKESVAKQTVLVYLGVLRLHQLYLLTLRNVRAHKSLVAKVRMKYHGGAGRKAEMDLAEGRLAQRRVSLHAVIGAKKQVATNFKQLVGFYPTLLIGPGLPPKLPTTLASAINLATKINPALLAAKASLQAADSAVAASRGKLLPEVNIELNKSRVENANGIKGVSHDSRAMVVVNYNLFNGGADSAAIDKAVALRSAALQKYLEVKRAVRAEVANDWHVLQTDRQQLKQDKIYVRSVKKVLVGYKQQFTLGRRSLLNLLDMENEVFAAEAAEINESYAVKYDSYKLIASVGTLVNYFKVQGK